MASQPRSQGNAYSDLLGSDLERIPKVVMASILVDVLKGSGLHHPSEFRGYVAGQWSKLYENGIVRQKPKLVVT